MIVVCGEALIDLIRDSDGMQHAAPGGGPFNTARALARLGVPTSFLGRLSEDGFGRRLAELLATDGVGLDLASVGPEPTTVAIAEVDRLGHATYRFEVEGTSAPNLTAAMVPARLAAGVNALHVGTLGLVLEPMATTLADLLRGECEGRLVMVDPNIRVALTGGRGYRERLQALMVESTIVKASETDLAWLYPGRDHRDVAEDLLSKNVPLVVVTRGAHGAYAAHGDIRVHVEAPTVEVVDTIGAGDAFGAGLLAWLHDHDLVRPELLLGRESLRAALSYACLAASLTCERAGADPPRKREMEEARLRFGFVTE